MYLNWKTKALEDVFILFFSVLYFVFLFSVVFFVVVAFLPKLLIKKVDFAF